MVGFGFSYYGVYRAGKYKKYSLELANQVYGCYQIPRPAADSIGEPLADTFMTWFPNYVEPVSKGIDPALAIGRLISVLQQTSENERLTVTNYQQRMNSQQNQPGGTHTANGNGAGPPAPPPEPDDIPRSEEGEWMTSQMPSPADVLGTPQTHIPNS